MKKNADLLTAATNGKRMLAAGHFGNTWYSDNGGKKWKEGPRVGRGLHALAYDGKKFYAVYKNARNTVFVSKKGDKWKEVKAKLSDEAEEEYPLAFKAIIAVGK